MQAIALALVLVLTSLAPAPTVEPCAMTLDDTDFIRFTKVKKTSRLETAIVTYENPETGQRISLVGAVHIADKAYYDTLTKKLGAFDVVLYEGVRGGPEDDLMTLVARLQMLLKDYLGLVHQNEVMRYEGEKFRHADLTAEAIQAALDDRGVELVPNADLLKSLGPLVAMALKVLKPDAAEASPLMVKMQRRLKETLGRVLGEGLAVYDRFKREGDRKRDEVIIGERNARVMKVLEKTMAAEGVESIAILYGAAHHPDLERRLKKRFKVRPVKSEWLPAWTIEVPKPPAPRPDRRAKDL